MIIRIVLPLWDRIEFNTGFGFRLNDDRKTFYMLVDNVTCENRRFCTKANLLKLAQELTILANAMDD